LVNQEQTAGSYEVEFNGNNLPVGKASLTSGMYFYRLQVGSYVDVKKMILLK
jgi:hypothetical protein